MTFFTQLAFFKHFTYGDQLYFCKLKNRKGEFRFEVLHHTLSCYPPPRPGGNPGMVRECLFQGYKGVTLMDGSVVKSVMKYEKLKVTKSS